MASPTGELSSIIKDGGMLGLVLSTLWPDSGQISFALKQSVKTTRASEEIS